MADTSKDTIYIDADDEITTIIDKVMASPHRIVALVLPKRASVLQSIVNMKLLKRSSDDAKKRVVLITSEATLLPLAGIAGMHVAKTLQTKPSIPAAPESPTANETVEDTGQQLANDTDTEPELDVTKPVGELSDEPEPMPSVPIAAAAIEETIDVDNTVPSKTYVADKGKIKKSKIKIPNFESFRLRLILGGVLLVALIAGWYVAFNIMPKASVVIKTDTRTVTSSLNFTATTAAKDLDIEKGVMPAEAKEVKKTDNVKVTATGKKNIGEKAKGTVSFKNCTKADGTMPVPAGTTISSAGLNFITQTDVVLPGSTFSGGGTCTTSAVDVAVMAQNSGDQYNLSARSYAVAGYSSVLATGTAMTGGTTQNVTVISQQDIDGAKQQLTDKSKDAATTELNKLLTEAKLLPLSQTLAAGDPAITTSPNVNDEAADVTVTSVTTYTMLGVKQDFLKKLIEADAKKQLDLTKQPLVDYGIDKATYNVISKRSGVDQSVSTQIIATAGAKLDAEAIKKEIVGKKRGDVTKTVEAHPGVKDVNVTYSPFWVSKVPKDLKKVTVTFEQTQQAGSNAKQ